MDGPPVNDGPPMTAPAQPAPEPARRKPPAPSRPAPVTPSRSSMPAVAARPRRTVTLGTIDSSNVGHRVVGYGPGGVGKTTLFASMPGPVAIVDLDESLKRLKAKLIAFELIGNIKPVENIATWLDLRDVLNGDGWDGVRSIVIDTGTKAEELATAHLLETKPTDKGAKAESLEDYGYTKGEQFLYEEFNKLLCDLDAHARAGRHVAIVAHECNSRVPNPAGQDWVRFEPRLQNGRDGKNSIRLRVKEWCDHLLFIGYDVTVAKGKASGGGSAMVYPRELPHFMAKSRTLVDTFGLEKCFAELWPKMLG